VSSLPPPAAPPRCQHLSNLTTSSAGSGTYGADGGNGGSIDILVDENMTHLLIAVEWDTRGGSGGPPGHHGKPGKGGPGGKGGVAYEWYSYLAEFVAEYI
jgi:hypothetical protein